MKKRYVFATNNLHKLSEVRAILEGRVEILSLQDIGCNADIPETGETLEENALIKARYVKQNYNIDCFADDTGLEVEALDNAPGVYSARYAGEDCIASNNIAKLLHQLQGVTNRKARFRTVIALIEGGKEYLFEGKIEGEITTERRGEAGFGYDPVFQPKGETQTFAELGDEVKNKISHRALAVEKLSEFIKLNS